MCVIVGRIAREHGGEVREGSPGVAPRGSRYLGIEAPNNATVAAIEADGVRAGLGTAQYSCAPDLGIVVWWEGSRIT